MSAKAHRYGVVWLMVFVAVIAVDCAIGLQFGHFHVYSGFAQWCLAGGLPTASILAIDFYYIAFLERQETRDFWLGFGYSGAMEIVLYLAFARYFPQEARAPFRRILNPIFVSKGGHHSLRPIFLAIGAASILLPRVLIALAGGYLFSRFAAQDKMNDQIDARDERSAYSH